MNMSMKTFITVLKANSKLKGTIKRNQINLTQAISRVQFVYKTRYQYR